MPLGRSIPAAGLGRRAGADPTPASRGSWRATLAAILRAAAVALLLGFATAAPASPDRIEVERASLESRDDGYYLSGEFDFDLKPRVADALDHGLTLYFVIETELTRSRWYWFDEKTVNAAITYRLSYHALTRQYRVSSGNLQLGFASLSEALGVLTHVRDWKVAERGALQPGQIYAAAVRMRLDTTQLPKPFQINALTSRDWTLESDWKRFPFEPR